MLGIFVSDLGIKSKNILMTELANVINVSWIRRVYRTVFCHVDGVKYSVMKPHLNSFSRTVQDEHQGALLGPCSFFLHITNYFL